MKYKKERVFHIKETNSDVIFSRTIQKKYIWNTISCLVKNWNSPIFMLVLNNSEAKLNDLETEFIFLTCNFYFFKEWNISLNVVTLKLWWDEYPQFSSPFYLSKIELLVTRFWDTLSFISVTIFKKIERENL